MKENPFKYIFGIIAIPIEIVLKLILLIAICPIILLILILWPITKKLSRDLVLGNFLGNWFDYSKDFCNYPLAQKVSDAYAF